MTLHERIAEQIASSKKLRRVPLPVIEAVLGAGFERLSEIVPAHTLASEIIDTDWEWCEVCGHGIDAADLAGGTRDSEGIYLCAACAVDGGPDADFCGKPVGARTPGCFTPVCQLPAGHDGKCVPVGTGA